MTILHHLKTFVPEAGVWVSTVAHDMEIGMGRTSETMVFKGDKDEITDWGEVDFEHLGYETDEAELSKAHNHMIEKWRNSKVTGEAE